MPSFCFGNTCSSISQRFPSISASIPPMVVRPPTPIINVDGFLDPF
ncbi:hypothetical protein SLEP1_g30408 [Rubroshorea leprosula]|uniref:Uncharacterized protein n=1 Tax=Rubroshorea leprosula TaxID=152421 RepID=A0AAV5K8K1_9ROSI|nr:hypothetical protein SLEP1_g30408 [Rubroshorea leprosula]